MSSIERTLLTLQHKIPDRVPVSQPNFIVTARIMSSVSFADFFRDGEAMAEGQIKTWRRFGHDVLILENGTAALAEACGVGVSYKSDTSPVAVEPAIRSLGEINSLKVPNPQQVPILRQLLKATWIVTQEIGKDAFIMARAD